MTLKIKIKKAGYYSLITDEEVEVIEKIADDYAIEFYCWMIKVEEGTTINIEYAKALLETFKKEKGL
jgi:hypothetical protein